jgi:putative ABC transport system permease protein
MKFIAFWFRKELRRVQTWVLGLLMMLGLSGLVFVDLFAQRISHTAEQDTRNFLSADFVVRSWSPFDETFMTGILKLVPQEDLLQERSLIANATDAKGEVLNIDLRAFDSAYPFYGDWILRHSQLRMSDLENKDEAFADTGLANLGYKIGDTLRIGSKDFTIRDFVEKDPQSLNLLSLGGYRIWIHRSQLEGTGLTSFGHRIRHVLYIRKPDIDAKAFREQFRKEIQDPVWQLTSAQQSNSQVQRTIKVLKTYLGLIALCGTFLGLAGLFMIFVSDLRRRLPQILTLRCLGLKDRSLLWTLLTPALVSVLLASVGGFVIAYRLERILSQLLAKNLDISLAENPSSFRSLALAIFSGLLSAIPALYFPIQKILQVPTQRIYSDAGASWILSQFIDRKSLLTMAWVAFVLSWILNSNLLLSLANLMAIAVLIVLLYAGTQALLKILPQIPIWRDFLGMLLKRDFARQRERTLLWILSLGFSFFFLLLGAFLTHSIQSQLRIVSAEGQPNMLIMGATQDDSEALRSITPANTESVPYIQARISEINNVPVRERVLKGEAHLDEDGVSDFRIREYFVNVRSEDTLFSGERLMKGDSLFGPPLSEARVRVSLEYKFANRMGLKLKDQLTLEIAGVTVLGQVTSLRKVDWFQFRPNFFIVLKEEDLAGAPLNQIHLLRVSDSELGAWQKKIVGSVPHLSTVDLRQTRDQLSKVISKLLLSVQGTSFFLLIAALLVLFSIFVARRQELQKEFALLRCLGESSRNLQMYLIRESLLAATLSWLSASLLAWLSALFVSHFVFESQFFHPSRKILLGSYVLSLLLVLALNLIMSRRTLKASPQELFAEGP